jgi:hypothetical protein
LSSARSGVPGAYVRLTSLIGCGTRRVPAKAAFNVMDVDGESDSVGVERGALVMVIVEEPSAEP